MLNLANLSGEQNHFLPIENHSAREQFNETLVLFSLDFSGLIIGISQASNRLDFWQCSYLVKFAFTELSVLKQNTFNTVRVRLSDSEHSF